MRRSRSDHRITSWGRPIRRLLEVAAIASIAWCLGSPGANAQFTRFQSYADEQGLDDFLVTVVTAFAQNSAGKILVGAEDGLYQFDGTRVIPYTAPGFPTAPKVQQIAFDGDDRLWVVAADGVYVRDKATFRAVDVGRSTLDDGSHHLLALRKSGAVLAAGGVLLDVPLGPSGPGTPVPLFDAPMKGRVPELGAVHFVVSDGNDGLLIGCGRILCVSKDGQVTTLGKAVGLPADDWRVALRAPDRTLWVRSLTRLAWRKPGETLFHVVAVPGNADSFFAGHPGQLDLVPDDKGGVLTQGDGYLLQYADGSWREFNQHPGGLPGNVIRVLFMDHEESLWAGSAGAGVFRSEGLGTWEHWTADDGLPGNTIWMTTRLRNGQFWVATDKGSASLGKNPARVSGSNYALAETAKGRLWLAPFGGALLRLDTENHTRDRVPFAPAVLDTLVDRRDRLWLGTRQGLFLAPDADAVGTAIHPTLVLPGSKMVVSADLSGQIWAASPSGVFQFGPDGTFRLVIPRTMLGTRPTGFSFAPDGTIWVATGGAGVDHFTISAGRLRALPSIRAPTIGSDAVLFVHIDRSGRFWVGTDHGIDMFDGRLWRRFDSSQGPISNDIDQFSVFEDVDGSMWFGTGRGLSHLRRPDHLPPPATLHPRVVSITLGNRQLSPSSRVTARWSAEPLVIRFDDFDYAQGAISFRYRLRGLDAGWSDTVAHEVRYAGMPVGRFTFELLARSNGSGVMSAPVDVTFRIDAPWWRRWWFLLSCVALAALSILGVLRARDRLLLQRQRHLEEVVQLRTAEIEHARRELERRSLMEQKRLEEMVDVRTAEIEQARTELQWIAMSDVLTGLANRRAIMTALGNAIGRALQLDEPLAILLCDIDHFKKINDELGHLAGDEVLIEFSSRVNRFITQPEVAGRYGGEEFLMILPGSRHAIRRRVLELQSAIRETPYVFAAAQRHVTFSGGVAFLRNGDTPLTIIARADAALYVAKKNGRDRITFEDAAEIGGEDSMSVRADAGANIPGLLHSRRSLETDLRDALREEQFQLHYQPIVNVKTDRLMCCEALLRWRSPSRGNVPPSEFIPFAEQVGLMPAIGDWVLRTACQEARQWPGDLRISVNLSPAQLRLPDLVSRIAATLETTGLPPDRLELELTETTMIDDMVAAAAVLGQIRALGVTIALDDFGTGYSSLSFLRTLPFDRLKIDRAFVQDLGHRPEAIAIVRAVVGLCDSLGAGVTAEGVELDRQIDLLREAGCSDIQGYRVGRPGPSDELHAWMTAFAASRRRMPV